MPHLLPRSQPPGLAPELLQAPLLAVAQATYFEDVNLTVSLTNLTPQAFIKSIHCMLGFVPAAGDVKLMGTLPQGTQTQVLQYCHRGTERQEGATDSWDKTGISNVPSAVS